MIKNYLKTAWRSLLKNKGFTAINVLGLALGLATCMLIVFYVADELRYDRYNVRAADIYRLNMDIKFGGNESSYASVGPPAAAAIVRDYPEVEQSVRFRMRGGFHVKKGTQNVQEDGGTYVDPTVFEVFTLPMISGDPKTALKEPHTVVITESTAKKYFNQTNAVGQVLTINDTAQYKVTGVIKDIPKQSHFKFDFLMSMATIDEGKMNTWAGYGNFNTYILLKPGADAQKLEAKFPAMIRKYVGAELQAILHKGYDDFTKDGSYFRYSMTPLTKIHLRSNRQAELGANSSIQYVYIFLAIACFILLIACVNFMNLSTARSANRAREVGVRKVLGSPRKYLVAQFMAESMMVTLIATIIAVVVAWAMLSLFNQVAGKELVITTQTLTWIIPALLFMVIAIGFLAGSYPAFYLSSFQPIQVLKGKLTAGFKGGWLRSSLVVFQFSISVFLIIGTLVIYNQLKYIQSKDLGYNRGQVLVVRNTNALGTRAKIFKEEVKKLSGVVNATVTGFTPTDNYRNSNSVFQDPTLDTRRAVMSQFWYVDEDYLNTMGMKMVTGRNFSKNISTDTVGIIINEAAANLIGKNVLNTFLYLPNDPSLKTMIKYHVIGVVKNFNFSSLRDNVTPVMMVLGNDKGAVSIRIRSANIPALLSQVETDWKSILPNQQFSYSFMDQDFDATYRAEQRISAIFIIFTTLAIAIACLGLFGLAAYAAEQRNKEIGIRKVLGAEVSTIVAMLSKDFMKLVLISILVATPLAWWAMTKWFLQGFAYHQNIQWWVIVLAAVLAMVIAFATISFQSIKAALMNPVKSLKSE